MDSLLSIEAFKEKYNDTLARKKKADEVMKNATEQQKLKWLPAYEKLCKELGYMIFEYKYYWGEPMGIEMFEGFKDGI